MTTTVNGPVRRTPSSTSMLVRRVVTRIAAKRRPSRPLSFGIALSLCIVLCIADYLLVDKNTSLWLRLMNPILSALIVGLFPWAYWLYLRYSREQSPTMSEEMRDELREVGESAYPLGYLMTLVAVCLACYRYVRTVDGRDPDDFMRAAMLAISTSIAGLITTELFRLHLGADKEEMGALAQAACPSDAPGIAW